MFKELVDRLVELGQEVNKLDIQHPPAEPNHVYFMGTTGGDYTRHVAAPAPRSHTVGSLAALVKVASDYDGEDDSGALVAWYSRHGITLLFDDRSRRDKAFLPLTLTPHMEALIRMESGTAWMTQQQFVRLLRITFAGCFQDASLLESVRRVKFRQQALGERSIEHGKASLGKSIESELTGTGIIPEQVFLQVPIFKEMPGFEQVACAIDLDPEQERFALVPYPGATEVAIQRREKQIGDDLAVGLEGTQVEVYYGKP